MSNVVDISIIVPAYNIDPYLVQCLDSLREQTFTNFECIIVNDGSTDGTKAIADSYEKLDERFTVVNKKNGGLSSARNAGFDVSKGKFVIFLDGDDFFSPKLLATLHAQITNDKADIAVANYQLFYNGMQKYSDPKIDFSRLGGKIGAFSYKTAPEYIYSTPLLMVWNKLFSTEFLHAKNIRHNEASHRAEDIDFVGRALVEANNISYVDEPLSFYRTGTTTSNVGTSYKYPFDVLDSLEGLKKFLDDKKYYKTVEKSFLKVAVIHLLGSLYFTETHSVHQELYERVKKFLLTVKANKLAEKDFDNEKDYRELKILLGDNYIEWLRYRITDLRDDKESEYIAYLLSEYQRKYKEEIDDVRFENEKILHSVSWKVTKPLRALSHMRRRIERSDD